MDNTSALEMLLKQLRKTQSNHEFLVQISRTTPN
jgi:transcription termination factor Rho